MKIFPWLSVFFIVFSLSLPAQAEWTQLSDTAQISLLTCGPGDALYSAFGHSAIRIYDPTQGIDYVYNYGTFDFNTPNFYSKFIRGQLDYQLSVSSFTHFRAAYIAENRKVIEQILNLSAPQKQALFEYLAINYQPENRYYRYDFFFDNCASRIRDVFKNVLGEQLQFDTETINRNATYYDLLQTRLENRQWADFGINLALGLPAHQTAPPYDYMYLPAYMKEAFEHATITHDGTEKPFVGQQDVVVKVNRNDQPLPAIMQPQGVFWGVFAIFVLLFVIEVRKKKYYKPLDMVLFTLTGLLGVLLIFLWTGTDHAVMRNNLHVLWASPFHLIAIFLVGRIKHLQLVKVYFLVFTVINLLLVVLWKVFPQEYHIALLPVILTLALRSYRIFMYSRRKIGG